MAWGFRDRNRGGAFDCHASDFKVSTHGVRWPLSDQQPQYGFPRLIGLFGGMRCGAAVQSRFRLVQARLELVSKGTVMALPLRISWRRDRMRKIDLRVTGVADLNRVIG